PRARRTRRARARRSSAVALVLEGDDATRRAGPGADGAPRARRARRTDERPRSARAQGGARPHPRAAPRGHHRVLLHAHLERRDDALRARGDHRARHDPRRGAARRAAEPRRAERRSRVGRARGGVGGAPPSSRRAHGDRRRAGAAHDRRRRGAGVRPRRGRGGRRGAPAATPPPEPRGAVRERSTGRSGGMSDRLGRIWAIALNTLREAVRNRVLAVLFVFAVALMAFSVVLGELSLNEEVRVMKDLGLAGTSLVGTVIALFLGVNLLSKELDRKTVYFVIPKPLHRWEFLVGKFFGLAGTMVLLVLLMSLILSAFVVAQGGQHGWTMIRAEILIALELVLLCAVALFFSSFSSPYLSAMFTACLWI